MISKWQWLWRQLTHTLWIRAALFALIGIVAALLALPANLFFPESFPFKVGADAVDNVLNIIASSMLAVTTFSLSVMVTAYQAASTNLTPRATQLLIQDTTSQNVLGTFIGSFLYALVAMIALSTEAYGEAGRFFLFLVTIVVIILVVVALLRWISHLTHFGRVPDSCSRVEAATQEAIQHRLNSPYLGGVKCTEATELLEFKLAARIVGYIQHIDVPCLQKVAEKAKCQIRLNVLSGKFVTPTDTLLSFDIALSDELKDELNDAFLIKDTRSFEQDPRFGLVVLSEIASRALSPSVNDPGTAIDIIGRQVRLFSLFATEQQASSNPPCPGVEVPALQFDDLLTDAFAPIIRDAGNLVEVRIRLEKAIRLLQQMLSSEWQESLQHLRDYANLYAEQELNERDLQRLQKLA